MIIDLQKHILQENAELKTALQALNNVPHNLTLFVVNDTNKLVGTLTDGDIRRGLIKGNNLSESINKFMTTHFVHLKQSAYTVHEINMAKQKDIKLLPIVNDQGCVVDAIDFNKEKTRLPVEAVIMAGGRGKRLMPLTDNTPKPLLKVGSKPILEHVLDHLIKFGIRKVHISLHYLGDQIQEYFKDGSDKGISIQYIHETKPLGTIGALSNLDSITQEHVLVLNADLLTNINYEELFLQYEASKAKCAIASIPYTVNIPYAIFERNGNRVNGLVEKPKNTHYANAGIYLFNKNLQSLIPKDTFFNATDFVELLIKQNLKVIHNPITGYWIDIGRTEDYERANEIIQHII